jgi:site-specific DNA recombinase
VRSAADSKRRRALVNPKSEWVEHTDERLRIVSDAVWQRVKVRQRQRTELIGQRIAAGLSRDNAKRVGRGPKYLFSGLLRCGQCGAAYTMASAHSYACASFVNGGSSACSNNARFRRDEAEDALVKGIRLQLEEPQVVDEVCRRVRARLRELSRPAPASAARIAQLETEVANMVEAIAGGALRGSQTLAERMRTAELELSGLKATAATPVAADVERLLPDLAAQYFGALVRLPAFIMGQDPVRARSEIEQRIGRITVDPTETKIDFYNDKSHLVAALCRAVGGTASFNGSGGRI